MRDVYRGRQAAMGSSSWEDTSNGRARSYRSGRRDEGDRSVGRSGDRVGRAGNAAPRAGDHTDRAGSRGWDDQPSHSSSRGERGRDEDWSPPGSGRSSARNPRGGSAEYDRGPRTRSGGRDDDPRERQGERLARGPRPGPGPRDMDGRPRGGPGGGERRPSPPRGGGIWGVEGDAPPRRRVDASDPRARYPGSRADGRRPAGVREGLVNLEDVADDEEKPRSLGLGKSLLIVLALLLLGVGGAFGYYQFTAPAVHGTTAPASSTSSTPSVVATTAASPSASATAHS